MALKRKLSPKLTLYRDREFPMCISSKSCLRHTAVVGAGGNVGDVRRRFHHLLTHLRHAKDVDVLATGPILKNPPFGYLEQDDFHNTVLAISTSMQPRAFLRFLLRLEKKFGRRRSFANAPRTLDLDILFFDGRVINRADLVVPHPHWHERESVVIPLQGIDRCLNIQGR